MTQDRKCTHRKGSVLIIVSGVLAALTLMAFTFAMVSRMHLRASRNMIDRQAAIGVAGAAIGIGVELLRQDETLCDDYRDPWFTPNYGDTRFGMARPKPGEFGSFHSPVSAEGEMIGVADLGWHINEDPPGDANGDGAPGIRGVDDDGDGQIDEGGSSNSSDDDEDADDHMRSGVDEDGPGDANRDNAPGIRGRDDDGDGKIDEDNSIWADNDGDGRINEDPPGCQYDRENTTRSWGRMSEDWVFEGYSPCYSEDFPGKTFQWLGSDSKKRSNWYGSRLPDHDKDGLVWEEGGYSSWGGWEKGIPFFHDGDGVRGLRRIDENCDGSADSKEQMAGSTPEARWVRRGRPVSPTSYNTPDDDEDGRASVWWEAARLWVYDPECAAHGKNYVGIFRSFAGALYAANAEDDDEDSDGMIVSAKDGWWNIDTPEGQIRDESSKINLNAHGSLTDPALFLNYNMQPADHSYAQSLDDPRFEPCAWRIDPRQKLSSFDVSLVRFFRAYGFTARQAQNFAMAICRYRYGADGMPGVRNVDDDGDNRVCECDGWDNDGDWRGWYNEEECVQDWGVWFPGRSLPGPPEGVGGVRHIPAGQFDGIPSAYKYLHISLAWPPPSGTDAGAVRERHQNTNSFEDTIDEGREGVDEPDEFDPINPKGDDHPFSTISEMVDALTQVRDMNGMLSSRRNPGSGTVSAVDYVHTDGIDNDADGYPDEDDRSEEYAEASRIFRIVKEDISVNVANLDTGCININMEHATPFTPANEGQPWRSNCWANDGLDNDGDGLIDESDGELFPRTGSLAQRGRRMAEALKQAYARAGVDPNKISDQVWLNIIDANDEDCVPSQMPGLYGMEGIHLNEVMLCEDALPYNGEPGITFLDEGGSRGHGISAGTGTISMNGDDYPGGDVKTFDEGRFDVEADGWQPDRGRIQGRFSCRGDVASPPYKDSYPPTDEPVGQNNQPTWVRGAFKITGLPDGAYVPIIIGRRGDRFRVRFRYGLITRKRERPNTDFQYVKIDRQVGRLTYSFVLPSSGEGKLAVVYVSRARDVVMEVEGFVGSWFTLQMVNPYIEFVNISKKSIKIRGIQPGGRDSFNLLFKSSSAPGATAFFTLPLRDNYLKPGRFFDIRRYVNQNFNSTGCEGRVTDYVPAAVADGEFPVNYGHFVIALSEAAYDFTFGGSPMRCDGIWGNHPNECYPVFFTEAPPEGAPAFLPMRSRFWPGIDTIELRTGGPEADLIAGGEIDVWKGAYTVLTSQGTAYPPYAAIEKIVPAIPSALLTTSTLYQNFESVWVPNRGDATTNLRSKTSQNWLARYPDAPGGGGFNREYVVRTVDGTTIQIGSCVDPGSDREQAEKLFVEAEATVPFVLDGPFISPGWLGFVHSDRGTWMTLHPRPTELKNNNNDIYATGSDGKLLFPLFSLLGVRVGGSTSNTTFTGNFSYPAGGTDLAGRETAPGNWRQLACVPGVRAKININTADHAVLSALFGTGTAAKIVKYRPYRCVEDIIGFPTPYTNLHNNLRPTFDIATAVRVNITRDSSANERLVTEHERGIPKAPFARFAFETFTLDYDPSASSGTRMGSLRTVRYTSAPYPDYGDFDDSGAGYMYDDVRDDIGEQWEWYRRYGNLIDIKSRFFTIYGRGRLFGISGKVGEAHVKAIVERVDEAPSTDGSGPSNVYSIHGVRIEQGPDGKADAIVTRSYEVLDM